MSGCCKVCTVGSAYFLASAHFAHHAEIRSVEHLLLLQELLHQRIRRRNVGN